MCFGILKCVKLCVFYWILICLKVIIKDQIEGTKLAQKLRGCLVYVFKQPFSVFKQHFTHFNTLFYPHVFSQIFLNNNFQFLNTHTKRTLNLFWLTFFEGLLKWGETITKTLKINLIQPDISFKKTKKHLTLPREFSLQSLNIFQGNSVTALDKRYPPKFSNLEIKSKWKIQKRKPFSFTVHT